MPANLVRPGTEKYWTRAKERAAEQGRAEDWPYVVGIYKRMTVNKSEGEDSEGEYWIKAASGLVGPFRGPQDPKIPPKLLGLPVVHKPPAERLEKGRSGGVERAYRVRGHPEVIEALDKQLLMLRHCGSVGASREVTMSIDGDGAHWLEIDGVPGELERDSREGQLASGRGVNVWSLRKKAADELEKGAMGGPNATRYFINVRTGGQVPSRERLRDLAQAYRPPKPVTTARLLDSGKPVYRLSDVFSGLGLDPDAQASWQAMLGPVIEGSGNEVALRQAIYATMRERKADGALGSAVLERAIKYRAEKLNKSLEAPHPNCSCQLVTVDELRKGEARGGTYYRRVMGKSGRYRYYYDQDKYEGSPEAHLDGEGASKRAIKARVGALLEKAGKAGVPVAELKTLTKRYGAKRVAGVLKSAQESGELSYKKGKLRAQARKEPKQ